MESYGKILVIAMPIFLLLIIFEKFYGVLKGNDTVPILDAASSITSGITNAVKDVLGLSVSIISYEWLLQKLALQNMQASVLAYFIAFIVIDFEGYWVHRISHKVNFFWNKHSIHHSSEEFNLACALRQSISSFVSIFTFLLIPAALLGVPSKVIAITLPLQLFAQFWYHTRHIGYMGFLENIIVTPSHHRVHHAINKIYMDKNLSQIFIVWDKLFGTFQKELVSEPPVYGISRPAQTWNPIKINFQHLWLLIKDSWLSSSWKDKFLIWIEPTGWRPKGLEEKYPVKKIDDVFTFTKYNTSCSNAFQIFVAAQILCTLGLTSYFFANIAVIGLPKSFLYGAFIFLSVYSITDFMDKNKSSLYIELIRCLIAFALIITKGWFGISNIYTYLIVAYFIASLLLCFFFYKKEIDSVKLVSI